MDIHTELMMVGQEFVNEQIMDKCLRLAEKIKTNCAAINVIHKQQHEQIKCDLEELLKQKEQVQQENSHNKEISKVEKQGQLLQQELSEARQDHEELSTMCTEIQASIERLSAEKERLLEEKERLDNETTILLPKRREEISLYANISAIRWDFDAKPDEVKGYISNKTDVKPFSFDKRKCSQYFIVNSLWDSMKEDW